MERKWVYLFTEIAEAEEIAGDWDGVRGLLGGKGANLADMTRLGVPVPPGFTVTTEACIAYLDGDDDLADDMWDQELEALRGIEAATRKRFGDPSNPLLVSCRSGARFSMPGMMDTILNLGMNDAVAEGMVGRTGDGRFVYDSYRRLIQMFGSVVRGIPDEAFEEVLEVRRESSGVESDIELSADAWREVTTRFGELFEERAGIPFPQDPMQQLRAATRAVFDSWGGKRAVDYRNATGIPHDLGTAVNIQTMVFGNMGETSATGVAMSRNPSDGTPGLAGDFLINAQGEDVVSGTRKTFDVPSLADHFPEACEQLQGIADTLEKHYCNMQDLEFTIENGELWLLQARNGKRTAQAEVRIAVDMAEEGLLHREEAVLRVDPGQVDFFLHPQFDEHARAEARLIGEGFNVSPGAAVGVVAFDADTAERWARDEKRDVIMVRPETRPDDVHGMLAARGIVTSRGGRASHAALVARQFGKPAVVGVDSLHVDLETRTARLGEVEIQEGDTISIDGLRGEIYQGRVATVVPDLSDPYLSRLMDWSDGFRRLQVWANADYPEDARRARRNGAQGIGLCRTEHMFFENDRLPIVRDMIMARTPEEREHALRKLLPLQRSDFEGLFEAMDGLPVVVRLLDPPLHEFLPGYEELLREVGELKLRLRNGDNGEDLGRELDRKRDLLQRVEEMHETNPMLGKRGVRLGILLPELIRMQTRALFEAAAHARRSGGSPRVEVMIPLVSHVNELRIQKEVIEEEARSVMKETDTEIPYKLGTMIEVPRAALTADQIASVAEFFSFGTNDLTQTVFAISRDDAESGFLLHYVSEGILPDNPFSTIDVDGVGRILEMAVELGRGVRPDLTVGICGEHGGDPRSVEFFHRSGLDYVSCSPFRVPIARLAAAHAQLREAGWSSDPGPLRGGKHSEGPELDQGPTTAGVS